MFENSLQFFQQLHFLRHEALYLLPLAVVVPLAIAVVAKTRRRLLRDQWVRHQMQPRENGALAWRPYLRKAALVGLFLAAGIVAVAQPSLQSVNTRFAADSTEVVAIVDDSRSMAATDSGPSSQPCSRLKTACNSMMEKIIPVVEGCPFGMVTFAGQAYPQVLFTRERKTALHFLNTIKVSDAPGDGSETYLAFKMAWKYFDRADKERAADNNSVDHKRVIVLFSDGGMDDKEKLQPIVEGCNKRQIQLLIFGLGGTKPTHVPVAGLSVQDRLHQKGEFYTFYDPEEQREVLAQTSLEEESLMRLQKGTASCGSRYQRINSPSDVNMPRLMQGVETVTRVSEQELFIYPTLLCVLSLFATALVNRRTKQQYPV